MWARLGIVAWVAACYSPQPSAGLPCGPGGACPEGQKCSSTGLCLVGDETSDARVTTDGMPADGDTPRKRWNIVATDGRADSFANITSTTAGNTILVGVETGKLASADNVTDNGGNTYQLIAGSRSVNDVEDFGVEVWMAQGVNAGADQITAVGPVIHAVVVWEVENLAQGNPVVAVNKVDDQNASTSPEGALVTTTEVGQFVLSLIIVADFITGINEDTGFVNDHATFGNGWAHLANPDAPAGDYQAQWNTTTNGTSCASSVVFRVADQSL